MNDHAHVQLHHHIIPVRTNLIIFGILMGLLVLTIVMSYAPLGPLHFATAMVIAVVKAVLIVLYFMHVKFSRRLVWVFSTAAFVWLGIMMVLTLNDYLTRGWLTTPGK
jgi:cytochrome c oxidase subunit 4